MYYVVASGKKNTKLSKETLPNLETKLKERNVEYKLFVSIYPGHAEELTKACCKEKDCQAIIAVGGDGTFYEILNGMDTSIPIGFIPAGTGNDFVRTLGIGTDIDECLDNILNNEPRYVDYLQVNDRRAFNVVGSGFDIDLLKREDRIRKKIHSRKSYYIALLISLFKFNFFKMTFKADNQDSVTTSFFMFDCCNGIWGGGMLPLCVDASPYDGFIDFVYITTFNKLKLLPLLLKFQKGKLASTKYVKRIRCKAIDISVVQNIEANLDGEILPLFPIHVEIVHNQLKYFPSSKPPIDPIELLNNRKLKKKAV